MKGWTKIKGGAKYAGMSERTLREWLKKGLPHSILPSGTILIKYSAIDDYLESYSVQDNEVDNVVNDVIRSFKY
jgi:predicted site-specific integrase-resolvase